MGDVSSRETGVIHMEILISLFYITMALVSGGYLLKASKWVDAKVRMPTLEIVAIVTASVLWPLTLIGCATGIILAWTVWLSGKRG